MRMKFLILKTKDPYLNLAIEEYLFMNEKDDVFILWQNQPTVVIGKNQNAYAEINMEVLVKKNIKIARRITGGGAVYHDEGNLNYTFISSEKSEKGIDFEFFTKPITEALQSLGVNAVLSGRNDLLADGKKFSGNAQYSFGGRVLHHGTLLFKSDLSVLSDVLNVDEFKIRSKGIKSTRSRVINLCELLPKGYTIEDFLHLIEKYITKKYCPNVIDAPNCEEIDKLRDRNSSAEWIFPKRELISKYGIVKKKRYPFGIVEISLDMSNDIIKDITIKGDFFGNKPISELENIIKDIRIYELSNKMSEIRVDEYIHGMTAEELCEAILGKEECNMVNNIEKFKALSACAFEFYQKIRVETVEVGRYEFDDGNYCVVSEYEPKLRENAKYEAHKKYTDIQMILEGSEIIGTESLDDMHRSDVITEYNEEKDIELYEANSLGVDNRLEKGDFIILLPSDAHMPGVYDGISKKVKKAVFKIKM